MTTSSLPSEAHDPEPVLQIAELTRRFGAKTALNSVSLTVPRGGVHGLVGANGAGKTTLLKHLLGLLRAQSGSVRIFGRDPVADPVAVLTLIHRGRIALSAPLDQIRALHGSLEEAFHHLAGEA